MTNYDVIGDVHGHADALSALLERMGYVHSRGAWRHPSRTAVFVGDLIDRGPANIEASLIVRRMVEEGAALIVMGNHEFNAVAYHTEDPEKPGEWLRPHNEKNFNQHGATHTGGETMAEVPAALSEWIHSCGCRLFGDPKRTPCRLNTVGQW